MAEFLELIESVRAEEASVQRLFAGEGVRTRGRRSPEYQRKFSEALNFIADVMEGRRPTYYLREAMTTSDFPQLFGDAIDRMVLASYRETPRTYMNYMKVETVPDFRTVKRFTVDGADMVLPKVAEQAEYEEASVADGEHTYAVEKYGRRVPFSWEAILNDDLQALRDIPSRLGRAARRSEEKFATELFVDANGPHASLYTAGNNNIVPGNPALSIAALQTAMQVLAAQTDADGEPVVIEAVELVVPPALAITAQNILNALQIELTESGGTSAQKLIAANWMSNVVRLNVNYYIPIVAANANGDTSWFLFARSDGTTRPAAIMGFLRGHEEPEIWMKKADAMRVGGGDVGEFAGSFDNDSINYRIRHVFGGTRVDPKATVASSGAGDSA